MYIELIIAALVLFGGGYYFHQVSKAKAAADVIAARKAKEEEQQRRYEYAREENQRSQEALAYHWEKEEQERLEAAQADFRNIPINTRFEHQWIVAGSGHGKSQTIQQLISIDIPHILRGERSVIVIDSQDAIIPLLAGLQVWEDHPDRLVYLDPSSNTPPALNLVKLSSSNEIFQFLISTLFQSSEFTGKQALIFDALLPLMPKIEDATLETFLDLLSDNGIDEYQNEIATLKPIHQRFLTDDYIKKGKDDQYKSTREEVSRRIWQILIKYGDMFCSPDIKVDLGREMQDGKLILIDTSKASLGEDESAMIGGIFIGLLYQAILRRNNESTPTLVYIDEAHEYFRYTARAIRAMLVEARKRNVGMVLAHQDLDQIEDIRGLSGALSNSTSIKMAGGVKDPGHQRKLAPMFATEPELLGDLPRLVFATYVKSKPVIRSFVTQPGIVEAMPRVKDQEAFKAFIVKRYASTAPPVVRTRAEPPEAPPTPQAPRDEASLAPQRRPDPPPAVTEQEPPPKLSRGQRRRAKRKAEKESSEW